MANTKRPKLAIDPKKIELITSQIESLKTQLENKLALYKIANKETYPLLLIDGEIMEEEVKNRRETDSYDFINPSHYVQDDGRQTWEHMVDKWGEEKTALWCEMTAFKYKDRIGRKPGEDNDREEDKIKWYEDKAEELNLIAKEKKFW